MSQDDVIYRPGQLIAGRYRITSPLSQGGMGAVYLAQQVSLGRDVALKVILERGSDPELIKRFDVEARAVCQLKHPNIITYHDYGRDDEGHPFLVMEFLAGYSGVKLVYGDRRPALQDLVHVVAQVCSALHEAHGKGIIHRDLKWSNVMICPQSHDPYFAKLIDFGIMKIATDGSSGDQRALTRTGMLLGTPEYMSPEAICGMPIDGRADQYSLAIMLWEALEGRRPFEGGSQFELLRHQVQEPPPPFAVAAELVKRYPALEAVILQGMEKHPDDRFADILAFEKALRAAAGLGSASTARSRPAARGRDSAPRAAFPPGERRQESGTPSSRTRLPAAPLTGPRPVDTRVKTGRQDQEEAPRRLHWAWLAGSFVVFLALGFVAVRALQGPHAAPAPASAELAAADAGPSDAAATGSVARRREAETEAPAIAPAPSADTADAATEVRSAAAIAAVDTTGTAPADTTPAGDTMPAAEATADTSTSDTMPATVTDASHGEDDRPRALAPGHLFVQVDPWGDLVIDGRSVGRAPFDGEMKAGPHTVSVTNTFFKGTYTFRIKVDSGKRAARTIVLEQHLEKIE